MLSLSDILSVDKQVLPPKSSMLDLKRLLEDNADKWMC